MVCTFDCPPRYQSAIMEWTRWYGAVYWTLGTTYHYAGLGPAAYWTPNNGYCDIVWNSG